MKKLVYVASPYTIGDQALNVRRQIDAFDEIAKMGAVPIAPLMMHFNQMFYPHSYDFWLNLDFEYVKRSDIVLRLPGESKGADKEVELAKSLSIPVVYFMYELKELLENGR